MKVAFFFDNSQLQHVDCRDIAKGNPGLGGSSYMINIIAYILTARDNGIDVTLFTTGKGRFAPIMRTETVTGIHDAFRIANEKRIDFFVMKGITTIRDSILFNPESYTKIIIWCHNFMSHKMLRFYESRKNVARIVTVGREQMDVYRDHRAFRKSEYIYNTISLDAMTARQSTMQPFERRGHVVTYMGCVIPSKGLHILAKAWQEVLKEIPDAELYIIGNGALYGGTPQMGKWGLAGKEYEAQIMRYLTKDGQLLRGVHLMGVLGDDKYDILAKTKVGVPNPSGQTETFCICAIEMQAMGARIVSKRCAGYLDTVKNGVLYDRCKDLAAYIVRELKSTESNYEDTLRFIKRTFSPDVIGSQWEELLTTSIPQGRKLHDESILANDDFELKKYKEKLRRIKSAVPVLYHIIPPLDVFIGCRKRITGFLVRQCMRRGLA